MSEYVRASHHNYYPKTNYYFKISKTCFFRNSSHNQNACDYFNIYRIRYVIVLLFKQPTIATLENLSIAILTNPIVGKPYLIPLPDRLQCKCTYTIATSQKIITLTLILTMKMALNVDGFLWVLQQGQDFLIRSRPYLNKLPKGSSRRFSH